MVAAVISNKRKAKFKTEGIDVVALVAVLGSGSSAVDEVAVAAIDVVVAAIVAVLHSSCLYS